VRENTDILLSRLDYFELSTHDPKHQPIRKFVVQRECYNVVGKHHSLSRAENMYIGIRMLPGCTDEELEIFANACSCIMACFERTDMHQTCIVVQPGSGEDW
jgi:hypothetical protein